MVIPEISGVMTMNAGDIVKLTYNLWIVEQDKETLFDTTDENFAKENGIYDPDRKYGPEIYIIGKKMLLESVEKQIMNAEVGKEYDIILEPKDAYGERNPNLVKVVSMREFEKNKITPEIGKFVTINGQRGKVVNVTPGRVLVDFNHPLAGKKLHYKVTVKEIVEGLENKVLAIIEMAYGKDMDQFKVKELEDHIEIKLAESCKYRNEWFTSKYYIVGTLRDYTQKDIYFIEVYEGKKEEEKKEEKKEENTAAQQ